MDGRYLVGIDSSFHCVYAWDLITGGVLDKHEFSKQVLDVCFLGRSRNIAVASCEGQILVLTVPEMKTVGSFVAHDSEVKALASPFQKKVTLHTSSDSETRLWTFDRL